jgi:hypothetical protein
MELLGDETLRRDEEIAQRDPLILFFVVSKGLLIKLQNAKFLRTHEPTRLLVKFVEGRTSG